MPEVEVVVVAQGYTEHCHYRRRPDDREEEED